jgi:hypothetical protein
MNPAQRAIMRRGWSTATVAANPMQFEGVRMPLRAFLLR